MITHSAVSRDGRRLSVREWGNPRSPAVFLLHGTPGSRLGPTPRDALLYRQGIRLIAYDRPGYGGSDRLRGRSVAHAAEDVADIADFLGIAEFSVVGRSGGGPHALACAALLPERVRRAAALVSLAPPDADGLDWFAGMTEGNVEGFTVAMHGHDELVQRLEALAREIRADPAKRMPFGDAGLPESDQIVISDFGIKKMLMTNFVEGLRTSAFGWVDDNLSFVSPWGFDLGGITMPVLLWHGRDDIFCPASHTEWLASRIRQVDLSIEAGAAHFGAVTMLPEALRWVIGDRVPPPVLTV